MLRWGWNSIGNCLMASSRRRAAPGSVGGGPRRGADAVIAEGAVGRTQAQFGVAPGLQLAGGVVPALALARVAGPGAEGGGEVAGGGGHRLADLGRDGPVDALEALLQRDPGDGDGLRFERGNTLGGPAEVGLGRQQGAGGRSVLHLGGMDPFGVGLAQRRVFGRVEGSAGSVLAGGGLGHRRPCVVV